MIMLLFIIACLQWPRGECTLSASSSLPKFPDDFMFGVSTAAYQIEGGWNADDKSPSIWDVSTHSDPCWIANCSSGDVAADSYHLYERDAEMLGELGVDFYRFSMSWPRVLPGGFVRHGTRSVAGIAYYRRLLSKLKQRNIQSLVTIYHFDLPQNLQDLGGWTNPLIIDWLADYARVLFEEFGNDVKYWITINEPLMFCWLGYGQTTTVPRVHSPDVGVYLCARHVLLAHAKIYHMYNNEFKAKQGGVLGMSNCLFWYDPKTNSPIDTEAANDISEFTNGLYMDPIYSKAGDFPAVVKQRVFKRSAEQGYPRSRLPALSPQEVEYIRGTYDFLGVNHYTTFLAYRNASANYSSNIMFGDANAPSYLDDIGVALTLSPEWNQSSVSSTMSDVPSGFYKLLTYIRKKYNNPPIIVTENGWSTGTGLEDNDRIKYIRGYLGALQQALEEGSDIRGYTIWSLMDTFEWASGYSIRYGLYEVDFSSALRPRTPRRSAFVYREIIRSKAVDPNYQPPANATMEEK